MSSKNNNIVFIKPCIEIDEESRELTSQYAIDQFHQGKIVQINLDNCSIQRMEQLPATPTLKNAEEVGLMPLVNILNSSPVSLTAIGVNEMPDIYVKNARQAYESFCYHFWPNHNDDIDATYRTIDESNFERRVDFNMLSAEQRAAYGSHYFSMLLIQKIKQRYKELSSQEKFIAYIHGIIGVIGCVSAFELELAKYAFWNPTPEERNYLPQSILDRAKDIHQNFTKIIENKDKISYKCFDAAMDIHWLSGANLSENLGHTLPINGNEYVLDNWVGTNDHKLYRISKDIHSVYLNGQTLHGLATTREVEMTKLPYWIYVDEQSDAILKYRKKHIKIDLDNLLFKIDKSTSEILKELTC